MKSKVLIFIGYLKEQTRPYFGQVALFCILTYCGLTILPLDQWARVEGILSPRLNIVTPLSALPTSILFDHRWLEITKIGFWLSATLWLLQLGIPWACWTSTLCFALNVSLCMEQLGGNFHTTNLVTAALVIFSLWYSFYSKAIKIAVRERRFYDCCLYPNWVSFLCIFCVGYFYFLSGWNKILLSGSGWVNGVSLQLWALAFGDTNDFATRLIVEHRSIAVFLQILTLILELGAIVGIFFSKLRLLVGLGLIGFHLGQVAVFGWDFYGNLILLVLFFLPARKWVDQGVELFHAKFSRRTKYLSGG